MDIILFAWPDWPEEWRDIAVILYGFTGTLLFAVALIFTIIIGLITTSVALKTRGILKDNVQPAMENVKATTSTVRTTVTFVSEYAINPVAKAYGTYQGARRFVSVLARFRGKGE
jgi:hypothetical protein